MYSERTAIKRSGVEFKYKTRSHGRYQDWYYFIHPDYPEKKLAHIELMYSSTKVAVNTEVPLVDLGAFISGVGGALGLFLGFSIIDTALILFRICSKTMDH